MAILFEIVGARCTVHENCRSRDSLVHVAMCTHTADVRALVYCTICSV